MSEDHVEAELEEFLAQFGRELDRRSRLSTPALPAVDGQGATLDEDRIESLRGAGIVQSFRNRREALTAFNGSLRDARRVVVVGSSLKGLIHPSGSDPQTRAVLQERVRAGSRYTTEFVLTHPAFADLRAEQESRLAQAIGQEILLSLVLLRDWRPSTDSVKVNLYLGAPTCFGILADDRMILNPYPYAEVAYDAPCLLLSRGGYFFEFFEKFHFRVLDKTMVVPVADLDRGIYDLFTHLQKFERNSSQLLRDARADSVVVSCHGDSELTRNKTFQEILDAHRSPDGHDSAVFGHEAELHEGHTIDL
jgi:hypothetical protein